MPGTLIVSFSFLSFNVLPVSAWSFQPTTVARGRCCTWNVCLRYVLGPTCPTAPSTPLRTTAGERALCKIRDVNCRWQEKAAKHTTLCHHSFLTGNSKEGVFWAPWLPSNETWNVFCELLLRYNNFLMLKRNSRNPTCGQHVDEKKKTFTLSKPKKFSSWSEKTLLKAVFTSSDKFTHVESQYWVTVEHILPTSVDGDGY